MLIDWFTVGAQIVNFLVLVVLLKLLLFDRVVAAMDRREQAISTRIHEAEEREERARAEIEEYEARQLELESDRRRLVEEAEAEAAERRSELIQEAREHVDELRTAWEQAVARDRRRFLEEIRRRTGEQVCTISRRALADLADADLERRLVRVAAGRIEEEADTLRALVEEAEPAPDLVLVRTSFPLDDDLTASVVQAVRKHLALEEQQFDFAQDPDLVCGIELRIGGWSVGWSVDGYLDAVAEDLEELLPTERGDADSGRTGGSGDADAG